MSHGKEGREAGTIREKKLSHDLESTQSLASLLPFRGSKRGLQRPEEDWTTLLYDMAFHGR